jgi:tripartite-type tricarboxylate transporter receptor subunit TctC
MTNLLRPDRRGLLGLTAAALLPLPARAQAAWPERNITLIVPFAPGGASDMIARLVAEALAPRIGRAVVVENRPGGAANIGVGALARSAPDGHTIGIVSLTTMGMNPWLYADRLPFDPARDFAFISNGAITPNVLVVNPRKIPAATLPELVAWLRANPGRANFGSSGAGSAIHVAMEVFLAAAGLTATHVPYRGSGPMMTDLIGGQIDMAVDGAAVAWPRRARGVPSSRPTCRRWPRPGQMRSSIPGTASPPPPARRVRWWSACRARSRPCCATRRRNSGCAHR